MTRFTWPADSDDIGQPTGIQLAGSRTSHRTRLQVELILPVSKSTKSVQNIIWRGRADSVQFGVTVPSAKAPGNLVGKVNVHLGGAALGHIRFRIQINAAGPQTFVGSVARKPEPQPLGDEAHQDKPGSSSPTP